ncbi:amidase [Pseudomonadota bacterium]|nr:amidase [Pseudomonadota bacterium]
MKEVWSLEANTISKLFKKKEISAVEIYNETIQHIQNVNPKINAVVADTFEYAKETAKNLDEKLRKGQPLGILAGVPVTVKVNTDQIGFASTNGLRIQKDLIAKKDSPVVDNLKKADAIIVGRTNTPAFSIHWFTRNSLHGHTLNPHNNRITPGGSSGGAAAATAAGIGAIGHGTDIAGSIRYPAYACGIHGLRPSLGRVPMINYTSPDRHIGGQIMAVSGPLARSITDLDLGLKAMSMENYDDPWWSPIPLSLDMPLKKVALITEIKGLSIDPIIKLELKKAALALEKSGWIIEEPEAPDFQEAAKFQAALWLGEFRRTGGEAIKKENDPDANFIYEQMTRRCPNTSLDNFMDALQNRAKIGRNWNSFFDKYPLMLCPMTGNLPFEDLKDLESPKSFDMVFDSMLPQIAPPYLGLPGMSFATGKTNSNIPLGVQMISRKFREDILLSAGFDLETHYPKIEPIIPNF